MLIQDRHKPQDLFLWTRHIEFGAASATQLLGAVKCPVLVAYWSLHPTNKTASPAPG